MRRLPLLLIAFSTFLPLSLSAADYSSWHIYWDSKKVLPATDAYAQGLEHIGAFAVHFTADGTLVSAFDDLSSVQKMLRAQLPHGRVFLTAVNDVVGGGKTKLKDPDIIHAIVSDPAKTDRHISQLLALAGSFDGIEIDYENLNYEDRDAYSAFIEKLAQATRKQGKFLSVVVEPKTEETDWDGAGAINWAAVGNSADMVKIMAYYLHYPSGIPGPVAPTEWVMDVTTFAKTQIPLEKLCIALVMNGVDWSDKSKGKTIDYESAMGIARDKKAKIKRERDGLSPYFYYKEGGAQHLVWFEDETSLKNKVAALERAGLAHIALWRLGSGDPAFWQKLRRRQAASETVIKR